MCPVERASQLSRADREIAATSKQLVRKFDPTATVVLFGSAARGTRAPDSDYDLLVLLERGLSSAERARVNEELLELELTRGVVLSSLFLTREEWDHPLRRASPFRREVEREGVVV